MHSLFSNSRLIGQLAVHDLKVRYLGSYLGILWAFIQPVVTILVLYIVVTYGFKVGATPGEIPFIIWLMAGMIPWFFVADALQSGTAAVVDNSYLIQKVVFPVWTLPVMKLVSALFIHFFFLVALLIICISAGYGATLYSLQIAYYLIASMMLCLGINWITSAMTVFVKDLGQVITVGLQIGFWATPIFWNHVKMNPEYHVYIKANPVFYIVNGYREALLYQRGFWEDWPLTLYFWGFCFTTLLIGNYVFRRMKPQFADAL